MKCKNVRIRKFKAMTEPEKELSRSIMESEDDLFLVEMKITRIVGSPIEFLLDKPQGEKGEKGRRDTLASDAMGKPCPAYPASRNPGSLKEPTYCAGCSFKCQASDCDCSCHDKIREYHEKKKEGKP